MKTWFQNLLGSGSATPVSTQPQHSADDLRLDALRRKYLRIDVNRSSIEPDDIWRPLWRGMLQRNERFIMVQFPSTKRSYTQDRCDEYHRLICPGPTRQAVSDAGGFEAFCKSDAFRVLLLPYVEKWQDMAQTWNEDSDGFLPFSQEEMACPALFARALDEEDGEYGIALEYHRFNPPDIPSPDPAKLIPPQPTAPGLSHVLGGSQKNPLQR